MSHARNRGGLLTVVCASTAIKAIDAAILTCGSASKSGASSDEKGQELEKKLAMTNEGPFALLSVCTIWTKADEFTTLGRLMTVKRVIR